MCITSAKTCTKCKTEKPVHEFYCKGPGRREARCKECVLESKRVARSPTKSKKPVTPIEDHSSVDPFTEEFGSEILMAAIEGFRTMVSTQRQQAVADYQASWQTTEQFNETN